MPECPNSQRECRSLRERNLWSRERLPTLLPQCSLKKIFSNISEHMKKVTFFRNFLLWCSVGDIFPDWGVEEQRVLVDHGNKPRNGEGAAKFAKHQFCTCGRWPGPTPWDWSHQRRCLPGSGHRASRGDVWVCSFLLRSLQLLLSPDQDWVSGWGLGSPS